MSPSGVPGAVYTIWWAGLIRHAGDPRPARRVSAPPHVAGRPVDPAVRRRDAAGRRRHRAQHGEYRPRWTRPSAWPADMLAGRRRSGAQSSTRSPPCSENGARRRPRMLLTLTLITVALVVLALAGYLIAIAWALLDTRKSVAAIADGLEAVRDHTAPLPEKLTTINGALGRCSAASRQPTAIWGGRPRYSGCTDRRGPHVLQEPSDRVRCAGQAVSPRRRGGPVRAVQRGDRGGACAAHCGAHRGVAEAQRATSRTWISIP